MYSLRESISYVFHYAYQNRKELLFTGILEVLCKVSIPVMSIVLPGYLLYLLQVSVRLEDMLSAILIYVVILGILSWVSNLLSFRNQGLLIDMRMVFIKQMAKKTLCTKYPNIEDSKARNQIERAVEDAIESNAYGVEGLVREGKNFLINTLGLIIYCILLSDVQVLLVVFMMLVSILQLRVFDKAVQYRRSIKEDVIQPNKTFHYLIKEGTTLEYAKDIRLYKMQSWIQKNFQNTKESIVSWERKVAQVFLKSDVQKNFLTLFRDGIAYAWLLYAVFDGMEVARFIICIQAVNGFSGWLEKIVDAYTHMKIDHHGICDFREYLQSDDGVYGNYNEEKHQAHSVVFDHVSFRYNDCEQDVIKDLCLTIHEGEKIALVGVNGAGKTTLVKLLCGLYEPSEGVIYIDGVALSTYTREALWNCISAVFQDVQIFAMTLAENVACVDSNRLQRDKVKDCLQRAGLLEKVESLPKGMDSMMLKILDEDGVLLSGGEKQKLMLARALYHEGNVLILDEPTAALDPIAESALYHKYSDLTKGKTSIFVTHRLSSTQFCDRILFLENGVVVEEGSHEELLHKQGKYATMYEVQAQYYQTEEGETL